MPTMADSMIPLPTAWDSFEEISRDALAIKWQSSNLTRNGRQGQRQHGVDFYGENDLGQLVGVQCKLVSALSMAEIEEEIAKAESFTPSLHVYYIATTVPPDAPLQEQVRLLSQSRVQHNKFAVGIFFWRDLIQELLKDKPTFQKHYPEFRLMEMPVRILGNKMLALLDLARYGTILPTCLALCFGELISTPEDFFRLLTNLTAAAQVVVGNDSSLVTKINIVKNYVMPWVFEGEERKEGWNPVERWVQEVAVEIGAIEYTLSSTESRIFRVGQMIARWDDWEIQTVNQLSQLSEDRITQLIEAIFHDGTVLSEARAAFARYRSQRDSVSSVNGPNYIYHVVRAALYP